MTTSISSAHAAMRRVFRVSWWVALGVVSLLPIVAAAAPNFGWPEAMMLDLVVLSGVGLVLACSERARAGLRMLPAMFRRPRLRKGGGLTAAHLSL